MERKITFALLVLVLACCVPPGSHAQCNPLNIYTTGTITGGTDAGQSFSTIASCGNGSITGITVWSTGSHSDATLRIYQGEGCSGTLLHTQTGFQIGDGMLTPTLIDVSPDLPFTAGQAYTFRLTIPGSGGSFLTLLRGTASAYPDGAFHLNCIPNTLEDLFFIVHTNSILPVELTDFQARLDKNSVLLSWRTESEKDNAGFEIERSNNGAVWQTLAFVPGNATTNEAQGYFFTDENPMPGDNYYRLKQLDFSGTTEFSETRHVRLAIGMPEDILVFPNPVLAGQTLTVQFTAHRVESAKLVDMLGNIIWHGRQFEAGKLEISLPQDLSKSLCWLVLEGDGERAMKKVLVQ